MAVFTVRYGTKEERNSINVARRSHVAKFDDVDSACAFARNMDAEGLHVYEVREYSDGAYRVPWLEQWRG